MAIRQPDAEMMRLHEPYRKTLIRHYLFEKLEEAEIALSLSRGAADRDRSMGARDEVRYWDNVCAGIRWLLSGIEPYRGGRDRDNPS